MRSQTWPAVWRLAVVRPDAERPIATWAPERCGGTTSADSSYGPASPWNGTNASGNRTTPSVNFDTVQALKSCSGDGSSCGSSEQPANSHDCGSAVQVTPLLAG